MKGEEKKQFYGQGLDNLMVTTLPRVMQLNQRHCNKEYRISSYSFRGNYSFLNLKIQRSQYIRPKITVHKCAETIQRRKLYEEIRYISTYRISPFSFHPSIISTLQYFPQQKFSLLGRKLKFVAFIWIFYNFQIQKRIGLRKYGSC